MSVKRMIKVAYRYGELESNVKKVLKSDWLQEEDQELLSEEFEEVRLEYEGVEKKYDEALADDLLARMKAFPVKGRTTKKEPYLAQFGEWKASLGEGPDPEKEAALDKAKKLLDLGAITEEEYEIIIAGL